LDDEVDDNVKKDDEMRASEVVVSAFDNIYSELTALPHFVEGGVYALFVETDDDAASGVAVAHVRHNADNHAGDVFEVASSVGLRNYRKRK
jgi:hypothetical protein